MVTTQQKLDEIRKLIAAELRHTQRKNEVLTAIAVDLQSRLDGQPCTALADIERRIVAMLESKTALGFSDHTMRFVAEGVWKHWATVRQALERFGASSNGGEAR